MLWSLSIGASHAEEHSDPISTTSSYALDRDTFKVATLNNFPPFSFTIKGQLMGFTVDYLQLLEEKTDLNFELVPGSWEENLQRFRNGEVDLITAISYTQERTAFTRYTEPYYIIPTVVYMREDSFDYQGVDSLQDRTVGIESEVFYRQYLSQYPRIDLKEIEQTDELLRQLSFGDIDAVVTNINIGNYMVKKYVLENVQLAGRIDIPEIKDEDLRLGVRKDLEELHFRLRNGMSQISPREYKTLQDRWVGFTPEEMLQNNLLPAEYTLLKEYKKRHGGLRLGSHGSWYPVDFSSEKGGHQGISADIFSQLEQKQEIPFTFVPTESFEKAFSALKDGRIDVLPAVVPSSHLRQELAFTNPYLSLPLVIATRRSEIFIQNLTNLKHKQIGYVKRGALGSLLKSKYPELTFVEVSSVPQGLERVRQKDDFAFVGSVPAITYAIQKLDYYNIKVSGSLEEKLPLAAAVLKENTHLLNIVQKSLNSMPLPQRQKLVDNWVSIRFDEKTDYKVVWTTVGIAALVVALSIAWSRKVQMYNAQISRANTLLEEKNIELQRLSVTDKLTGLFNRSKLDHELAAEQRRFERSGQPFSLILLDIDWFKSINDNFGHLTGDKVLKKMADLLKARCRENDIVGRWGGEEFLILCPDTDLQGASKLAEDIRADVESFTFATGRVTISGGVVVYDEAKLSLDEAVRRADQRLYLAKEEKNRIISADKT
ncbi:MAG: transporter substrate-binding domain-containing diguanylate cyclase [Thermodesulfobacteriota bacterium]